MTHKQRMLNAIKGLPTDHIPWVPRLDLWYNSNKYCGTLPKRFKGMDLMGISNELGAGFHAVVPQFKILRTPEEDFHNGLGIYNLKSMPYRTDFSAVPFRVETAGDERSVTYSTPLGEVRTRVLHDDGMRRAGISISHVSEKAIKSADDYRKVGWMFDHIQVEPNLAGYEEFKDSVGEQGLAVAFISLAGSPMHLILRDLMPFDMMMYEMYDHPDEMAECSLAIGRYYDRVFAAASRCSAEVFLLGANYDTNLTFPPFFDEHIKPWLKKFGDILHKDGKYLLTHTDGENAGLLDSYLASGFDIADSICPQPMTSLDFGTVRKTFNGRIAIMGGIPSVCLLKDAMPDADFERYLDKFFFDIGKGDRLILGISDTTPPAADMNRLVRIGQMVKEFGPVKI